MKSLLALVLLLALVTAAGAYVWRQELGLTAPGAQQAQTSGSSRRGATRGGGRGEGPVSVLAEASRLADIPVVLEAVGTAQALNTVTVRPQVEGRLLEIAFREGQEVKRGDVLARIDPTIYQAQYDQALARKAQNEANLANARMDLQRYTQLASTNAGSRKQEDTQRAMVAQLEAQVQADQGAIDSAKAYLGYTTITAPIDGRIGFRQVDQGNLVRAGDAGIVVITQLKPISVLFNLPQQNLRAITAAAQKGPLPVEALESDNRTLVDSGRLEVVDNQVDPTTGTVKLKAAFPNGNLQLWPGSFVNVRLTVDVTRNAVVVPTAAVQRGPNGAFVYAVVEDRAVLKPVTVARQTEALAIITSGLTPPERVVTTGFARLTDGDRVRVADPDPAAAPQAAVAPGQARPEGEARPRGEGRRRPEGRREAGPPGPDAQAATEPPPLRRESAGPEGGERRPRQGQAGQGEPRQDARAARP